MITVTRLNGPAFALNPHEAKSRPAARRDLRVVPVEPDRRRLPLGGRVPIDLEFDQLDPPAV